MGRALARGVATTWCVVVDVRLCVVVDVRLCGRALALARGVAAAWCVVVDVRLCFWYVTLLGGVGCRCGIWA